MFPLTFRTWNFKVACRVMQADATFDGEPLGGEVPVFSEFAPKKGRH